MIIKKTVIGTILIFTLALPIGCSVEKAQSTLNNNSSVSKQTVEQSPTNNSQVYEVMKEFNSLIGNAVDLVKTVEFIDTNIQLASQENASTIINKLGELQKQYLPILEEKYYANDTIQSKINSIYTSDFDINKISSIQDEELKDLLTETLNSGYKIKTAEGMYFPIIDHKLYDKYSLYVTPDMKEYIDIMSTESEKAPAKDAALVIEWDELLKRSLSMEKFINKYPESIKVNEIKKLYENYTSFILFGLDNTPLFHYDTKAINSKAKAAYIAVAENNRDSKLADTLRDFLDILEKNNYKLTVEVDNYRKSIDNNIQ